MLSGIRYTNSQMSSYIDEYVHNESHRLIMKLRFIDGWTYERIAEHKDIDRTVRQINYLTDKYFDDFCKSFL